MNLNRSIFKKLLWSCIFAVFIASLTPNIFAGYWILDIFSNYKVQYIFIAALLIIGCLLFLKKRKYALVLLIISIIWNASYVVPLYLKSEATVISNNDYLKMSSINLLSSNTRVDLVEKFIKSEDPDFLVLMEYTPHWEANLSSILRNYRYKATLPRLDNFGIAVLSKREMSCKLKYYGLENKPSLVASTSLNNKPLTIIATHPVPPIGQSMFQSRNQHLVNILNDRNHLSENLVIIGDLNTSSFSNHFRKLTKAGLKDSRNGFGVLPTWPANFSLLQTTLDHCLVSENIKILERSVGSNTGSDHLPITLKLGLE